VILIFGRNEFFGRSEVKFLVEMSLIFDFWSKGSLLFDMFICYLLYLRLYNLKRQCLYLAGTKNSSWTDRGRKSGRFERERFQVFSTMISIKRAMLST